MTTKVSAAETVCKNAPQLCVQYTNLLEQKISILEETVELLKKQRNEAYQREASCYQEVSILPTWAWVALGGLTGAVTYSILTK